MIAQTRFRFLRAAWKASRRSPSGAAMRFAESRAAVVSEQVLLRPRATVPPSQWQQGRRLRFTGEIFSEARGTG
jgi:hypothetical protein